MKTKTTLKNQYKHNIGLSTMIACKCYHARHMPITIKASMMAMNYIIDWTCTNYNNCSGDNLSNL